MTAISHLRYSPLSSSTSIPNPRHRHRHRQPTSLSFPLSPGNLTSLSSATVHGGPPGVPPGGTHGGGNGDSNNNNNDDNNNNNPPWWENLGILGMLINGWNERVSADPQFPFKVLMEEVVGLTSCVIGDMASRPNFGLNELDFVFSTLVVGSILNFTLMYLLAPTLSATSSSGLLPGVFSACPPSHMFEPGAFGLVPRVGTFVYKGIVFAAVGFAAGLVGTAVSNGLIAVRKRMDSEFETPNKPPPTLLNAVTWAAHMGLSSNFRYQGLNGVEYVLDKALPPVVFKTAVVGLRCANNVLGGMSFVVLARLTGSQSVGIGTEETEKETEKVVVSIAEGLPSNQST